MAQAVQTTMKVWSDLVHDTAIAKTNDTFDAIETNQKSVIVSKPDAKSILGFIVGYNMTIVTDAENFPDLRIQVNSKALGISQEEFLVPNCGADADANTDYTTMRTAFVPWKIKPEFINKLFNAAITFKASSSVTNTGGLDVVAAVVYSNQEPDSNFAMELLAQLHGRVTGGDTKKDAAKAHAAAATAVELTSLIIPAGTFQLRALYAQVYPNAITASKPVGGFVEFFASGISDFSPQLWPFSKFFSGALGTVADSTVKPGPGRYWPTRFPLTGSEITLGVKTTLIVAATDAPDTSQSILYE